MRLRALYVDITTLAVDAIVNAANESLIPGDGVCGAIHRAAGPQLHRACLGMAPVPTGRVVVTPAFRLPCQWVLHAVGPIYHHYLPHEAERLLAMAYRGALRLAHGLSVRSIAFPCISTGIYGYPAEDACRVAIEAVRSSPRQVDEVRFCCFSDADYARYRTALEEPCPSA